MLKRYRESVQKGEISYGAVTLEHFLSAPDWCSYIGMGKELINGVLWKWLGKEISHIFSSGKIIQSDDLNSAKITNKMVVNFNVFSTTMKG